MAKHRIMVVEDEAVVAMDIKLSLERLGYEVSCMASSCQEAIEGACRSCPDLVLMDIMLEGDVDGIETAARIQSTFDVPVIYLTAYADDDTLDRAKATQPFGYLLKPLNVIDLQTSIEIALYKHEMERRLKESEERFRGIAERSVDAIFTADLECRIMYMSPAIKTIAGYAPEEVTGKLLINYIPESHASNAFKAIEKVLGGDIIEGFELEILKKDGSLSYVEVSASPIFKSGVVIGGQGIIRDISERKAAEAQNKEANERLSDIIDFLPDATLVLDKDKNVIAWNRALESLTGTPKSQVMGKDRSSCADAFYGMPGQMLTELLDGNAVADPRYIQIDRVGDSLYAETIIPDLPGRRGAHIWIKASHLFDSDGNAVGAIESIRDITERKLAEEALRKSNARYRAIVEDQTEMICRSLPDGSLTFVNGAYRRCFRKGNEDLIDHSFFSFIPEEDRAGVKAQIASLCREAPTATCEHRVVLDDEERWHQWTYRAIFDERGELLEIQSAGRDITELKLVEEELRDARRLLERKVEERTAKLAKLNQELLIEITERKQVEERLRKSNARYRAIVEDQTEIVCRFLPDGTFTFANEAFCKHIGKGYDELIGQGFLQLISEEDRSFLESGIAALSQGLPLPLTGENRFLTPGREARWIQWTVRPIFGEYGNIIELQAVGRDVTPHKRMEEALRASEERYRAVFNAVPIGIGIGDLEGNILAANQAMLETKGLTSEELTAGGIFPVYADQRERKKLMAAVQISGRVRDFKALLRRRDGSTYSALLNLKLIKISGRNLLITTERQI